MTLKGHYALCFKTHACFGAHHENFNLKIDVVNVSQMTLASQYKVYVNIREGSFDSKGRQTTVG